MQPKVPGYIVRILEKQAEFRTTEDIETIANLLDGLQSFRKYSRQMQLSMCRIVRYMKLVELISVTRTSSGSLYRCRGLNCHQECRRRIA